jgi:hypothetical protein
VFSSLAQEAFPVKPIRWVVPWVAGTPGEHIIHRALPERQG